MLELGKKVLRYRGRKAEQIGGDCKLYQDDKVYMWGTVDMAGRYFEFRIMAVVSANWNNHEPILQMQNKTIVEFTPREDIFNHMKSLIILDLLAE
jgi:hypothetical protein